MDYATIVGIVVGLLITALAIFLGGSPGTFVNIPSILIVVGGMTAATLIRFPMKSVLGALKTGASMGFNDKSLVLEDLYQEVIEAARVAKTQGVMQLESFETSNTFMSKGLLMCSDDSDPGYIRESLENERDLAIQRLMDGEKIFRGMGDAAPAFGMIGTLIGLVQMLSTLSDPEAIGPAMAVALLTTLYGALLANLICLPVADKLQGKIGGEELGTTMMIEGCVMIAQRKHPDIIAEYLQAYLPDHSKPAGDEDEGRLAA